MDNRSQIIKHFSQRRRQDGPWLIKRKVILNYIETGKEFKCCYCKIELTCKMENGKIPETHLTLEHIKPVHEFNEGQSVRNLRNHPCNDLSNLTLACWSCNIYNGLAMIETVKNKILRDLEEVVDV